MADNVDVFETSMRDYLEYLGDSRLYNSRTLEIELEFDSNIKDAIEVSIKIERGPMKIQSVLSTNYWYLPCLWIV